jgi:ABC-type Fe3+-siderophore transport system permease subunit
VNPYLLGVMIVYILTVVAVIIAQLLTPHQDCPVCFILILSTPLLLYLVKGRER